MSNHSICDSTHAILQKLSQWILLAISFLIPSSVMLLFLRLVETKYIYL